VTPSEIGARAELAVATALAKAGYSVFVPLFNGHGRVDLVYEDVGGNLHRVQCKTSRVHGGVVTFRTCSNTANNPHDYRGQVDLFGVYSPDLEAVFMVPLGDVPTRLAHLRLEPPRNGQGQGIRWAEPYRLGPP
jgi:hypothetical protein